jgi:hypothetical protein
VGIKVEFEDISSGKNTKQPAMKERPEARRRVKSY